VNSIDVVEAVATVAPSKHAIAESCAGGSKWGKYFCNRIFWVQTEQADGSIITAPENNSLPSTQRFRDFSAKELSTALREPSKFQLFWARPPPSARKSFNQGRIRRVPARVPAPDVPSQPEDRAAEEQGSVAQVEKEGTDAQDKEVEACIQRQREADALVWQHKDVEGGVLLECKSQALDVQLRKQDEEREHETRRRRDDNPRRQDDKVSRLEAMPAERRELLRLIPESLLKEMDAAVEKLTSAQVQLLIAKAPELAASMYNFAHRSHELDGANSNSGTDAEAESASSYLLAVENFWQTFASNPDNQLARNTGNQL
jgi:hypothetical protein